MRTINSDHASWSLRRVWMKGSKGVHSAQVIGGVGLFSAQRSVLDCMPVLTSCRVLRVTAVNGQLVPIRTLAR